MKTSQSDVNQIEAYLTGKMPPADRLVFKARLIINPLLRLNVAFQQKTYTLIKAYGRKKRKADFDLLHTKLFNDPEKAVFQQEVLQLFK
jgi:hypothetical protein